MSSSERRWAAAVVLAAAIGLPALPSSAMGTDPGPRVAPRQPATSTCQPPYCRPVSQAPVSQAPVSQTPVSQAPVSQAPSTPRSTYGWNFGTQPYPYTPSDASDVAEPSEPPNLDLAVGTKFPLGFGPELSIELPGRVLLQGEVGWMPAAYGSAIAGFVDSFGKEGAVIGSIVEEALADSWVFAATLGWRPLAAYGFELVAGYLTIGVDGEVPPLTVADLLPPVLRREVLTTLTGPVEVSSQLHHFHVGLGWRWLAYDDHLVLRARVGYTQAVASASSATLPGYEELEGRVNPELDARLDEAITNDVKLPIFGLNVGYRF